MHHLKIFQIVKFFTLIFCRLSDIKEIEENLIPERNVNPVQEAETTFIIGAGENDENGENNLFYNEYYQGANNETNQQNPNNYEANDPENSSISSNIPPTDSTFHRSPAVSGLTNYTGATSTLSRNTSLYDESMDNDSDSDIRLNNGGCESCFIFLLKKLGFIRLPRD